MTGLEAVTATGDEENLENEFVPGREILHSQLRNQTICNVTIEMERRDCVCILGSH